MNATKYLGLLVRSCRIKTGSESKTHFNTQSWKKKVVSEQIILDDNQIRCQESSKAVLCNPHIMKSRSTAMHRVNKSIGEMLASLGSPHNRRRKKSDSDSIICGGNPSAPLGFDLSQIWLKNTAQQYKLKIVPFTENFYKLAQTSKNRWTFVGSVTSWFDVMLIFSLVEFTLTLPLILSCKVGYENQEFISAQNLV